MKVNPYLERIKAGPVKENSLEELSKLQYQHMLHVPFENLDVMHHVPIPLDVEVYYKKVVLNHRGGFCYELNGLFHWLLQSLGFSCQLASATINRPDGTWARSGSHACTIVMLDQPYLVDVGFGDSARSPLSLTGEIHEDISGTYRVKKVETHIYDVERQQVGDDAWDTIYRLDTKPMNLKDFAAACEFNQTSMHSPFTQKEIVTLATLEGRVTLSGNTLTITRHGVKQQQTISEEERPSVLEKYFRIGDSPSPR